VLTHVKTHDNTSCSNIGYKNDAVSVTAASVRLYSSNGLPRMHNMFYCLWP